MKVLYTARGIFDRYSDGWDLYKNWSRLTQLTELITLDGMLNEVLVNPDYDNADDWNYIYTSGQNITAFFTSLDYVLKRTETISKFNLLTVVINPDEECRSVLFDDFEFVGYDLLDQDFCNSALTNCGGFDETFLPSEQNNNGLIDNLARATEIRNSLRINNPEEHHADTNIIAVWRHTSIGR